MAEVALITIEVRTKPGEAPTTISTDPKSTVGALKRDLAQMHADKGWDASSMELIRQGKVLEDTNALETTGLSNGDFLVATGQVPRQLPPPPADGNDGFNPESLPSTYTMAPIAAVEMQRE